MRLSVRALALVLTSLLVGACAQNPILDEEVAALPQAVNLQSVPFFAQDQYQCGPAALAATLTHRGTPVTPEQLVPQVYLPGRKGSLQIEMVAAARSYDSLVYPIAPSLNALFKEVAAGNPVLILQNLGTQLMPVWHFAVVVGYDLPNARVLLRSGVEKNHWMALRTFDKTWARAERWAVLTLAPNQVAATAKPEVWLQAASDLEQVGQHKSAAIAYQTATQTWPEQGHGWFAYANQQYAKGDKTQALSSMQQAITVTPTLAAAWYNLAWMQAEHGCTQQARTAAQCAQQLAPDDARFKKALPAASHAATCSALPACPKAP